MNNYGVNKVESINTENEGVVRKVRKKINFLDFLIVQVAVCVVVSIIFVGLKIF